MIYEWGTKDVHYHSVRADYPIAIEFSGSLEGSIYLESKKDLILLGPINNETGTTTLKTGIGGKIEQATNLTIKSKSIILDAGTGIGTSLQFQIDLKGGQLDASTDSGLINIREISGDLKVGTIQSDNGNVILTAQTSITPASGSALVKGNLVTLIAELGSIAAGTVLRIDTGANSLIASAVGDINLQETSGSVAVISVVSTDGNVSISVLSGSLTDGDGNQMTDDDGHDISDGITRAALLGLWTDNGITGSGDDHDQYSADQIKNLLQISHFKKLTDTDYQIETLNIKAKRVTLSASGGIGDIRQYRVNFSGGLATLSDETRLLLAAAEPGDIVFYDSDNVVVDPASGTAAYFIISVHEDVDILATTDVTITATGDIYLSSEEDLKLITVSGADTRLRSGKSILSVLSSEGLNITCGSLLLEAARPAPSAKRPRSSA